MIAACSLLFYTIVSGQKWCNLPLQECKVDGDCKDPKKPKCDANVCKVRGRSLAGHPVGCLPACVTQGGLGKKLGSTNCNALAVCGMGTSVFLSVYCASKY
jgi:hypothetical protein